MAGWASRKIKPDAVVAHIKHLCDGDGPRKPKLTLLIGAGCSVSAGIPTAKTIVGQKLRSHPLLVGIEGCPSGVSEYAHLMGRLPPEERMSIIEDCISEANLPESPPRTRLNWAHLLIATLVHHGYVKQILTTNFDPLLVDAMAITDQPVRTFDLTAADWYMPGRAKRGSIMYLHGQAHGMLQAHTQEDTDRIIPRIKTALQEALTDSTILVVGYSGECDPVFRVLEAEFPQFRNRLYWAHFDPDGKPPSEHVINFIETPSREAFLLVDDDDSFMEADTAMHRIVVDGLKLPLLPLVCDPLDHTRLALNRLCGKPKPPKDGPPPPDPVDTARKTVGQAIKRMTDGEGVRRTSGRTPLLDATEAGASRMMGLATRAAIASMTRDVEELRAIRSESKAIGFVDLNVSLFDGFLGAASDAARKGALDTAAALLREAEEIGSDNVEWLLTLWGNVLSAQAKTKTGAEADRLFAAACEKYAAALKIKPDMYEALNNWGAALAAQGETKSGTEADRLFAAAFEKYSEALKIKPDKQTLFNLACLEGLCGRVAEVLAWLNKWADAHPNPTRAEIDADTDFDRVRDDPAFAAYVATLP